MKTRSKILIALGLTALLGGTAWFVLALKPPERGSRVRSWERVAAQAFAFMGIENSWTRDVNTRVVFDRIENALMDHADEVDVIR